MTILVRRGLWAACILFLACSLIPRESLGQTSAPIKISDLEAEVAALFERSCTQAGCHGAPVAQMNMNLTADQFYSNTVNQPSMEKPDMKRVEPGHPEKSYLVDKIKGVEGIIGLQMPMTGDKLTDEEIAKVEQWIREIPEDDVKEKKQSSNEVKYPFYGWKVLNLPTTRSLEKGNMLFLIGHRFNPLLSDGYDAFFGLDGSGIIYISLGYAITDKFMAAIARSNSADDIELQGRYSIAHQGGPDGGWPIGVSVQGSFNYVSQQLAHKDRFARERFKTTLQVSMTRQIGDRLGVAVVPGILLNPAEDVDGEPQLFTVGFGGRYSLTRSLALIGEWTHIASGFTRTLTFGNDIRFDTWGGGLEIATAGHVFQIVVTNSVGITSDQYLRGGDLDLFEGDMRLGFNIFRVLN